MAHLIFYAPMKSPDHPNPSGDRAVARSLVRVLEKLGHIVHIPPVERVYIRADHTTEQWVQLKAKIQTETHAWLDELQHSEAFGKTQQPDAWVTYHNYHKSPDLLGPNMSRQYKMPYLIFENSYNPRHDLADAHCWGRTASLDAMCHADHIMNFIPADDQSTRAIIQKNISDDHPKSGHIPAQHIIKPFLDQPAMEYDSLDDMLIKKSQTKQDLLARYFNMDMAQYKDRSHNAYPTLFATIAMMRDDQKKQSYQVLAESLIMLYHKNQRDWRLLIIGDGHAKQEIHAMFGDIAAHCCFLGQQELSDIERVFLGADALVWPGIKEAYGRIFMEAMRQGTPAITNNNPGIQTMIHHGHNGISQSGSKKHLDPHDFAKDIESFLNMNNDQKQAMQKNSFLSFKQRHTMDAATIAIHTILSEILQRKR